MQPFHEVEMRDTVETDGYDFRSLGKTRAIGLIKARRVLAAKRRFRNQERDKRVLVRADYCLNGPPSPFAPESSCGCRSSVGCGCPASRMDWCVINTPKTNPAVATTIKAIGSQNRFLGWLETSVIPVSIQAAKDWSSNQARITWFLP